MEEIRLTVCTLHGDKTAITVGTSDYVQTLKEKTAGWQNTTEDNVILTLKGRFLDEDLTLETEGVRDGMILIATIKDKHAAKLGSNEPAKINAPLNNPAVLPAASPQHASRGVGPVSAVQLEKQPEKQRPAGLRLVDFAPRSSKVSASDLAHLVRMGYDEEGASIILQITNGNVEIAASLLAKDSGAEMKRYVRDEIRKDPSKLAYYKEIFMQDPEIREREALDPGMMQRKLEGDDDDTLNLLEQFAEMGFTEEQVQQALAEAKGNEELALELLLKCYD